MRNIIVTTPYRDSNTAIKEAEHALANPGTYYFRTLNRPPRDLAPGDKVYYVERGYIRGYAIVEAIVRRELTCQVTGRDVNGWQIMMPADSWQWIFPVRKRGFRHWQYYDYEHPSIGDWRQPRPGVTPLTWY